MNFNKNQLEESHQFEMIIAKYINHFIRALHVLFSIALMITVILTLIILPLISIRFFSMAI